jgi:hypothetical protein
MKRFMEYATQMEGMAVLAVWGRRRADGAFAEDGDYVALGGEAVTRAEETRYLRLLDVLLAEGDPKDTDEALERLDRFSSGDRCGTASACARPRRLKRPKAGRLFWRWWEKIPPDSSKPIENSDPQGRD